MLLCFTALRRVDDALYRAFAGEPGIENTIILDLRMFRSNMSRMQEKEDRRAAKDTIAYEALKRTLKLIGPKGVLLCQWCLEAQNTDVPEFTSST
jgi:hypothetical protein